MKAYESKLSFLAGIQSFNYFLAYLNSYEVSFAKSFTRAFRKKVITHPGFEPGFWERMELFIQNPFDPVLKTHKLSGQLKDYWSFSIEYDCRVVFYFTNDKPKKAVFIDIGNHSEVY